jgi:phosphate transport system permease protein
MLALTLLITVPLGTLGGIYLAEYASENRLTNAIRLSQELVGSVPSIVVGLFGLALFVNATGWSFTAIGGALALTVFNLPLMARLAEQAIRAVPPDERSASLALGASKWQTIQHVVLPIAIPGIVTGIILTPAGSSARRRFLLFTAGLSTPVHYDFGNLNLTDPRSPWSPFHPRHDAVGLHLEDQLGGARPFVTGRGCRRRRPDHHGPVFNLGARGLGRLLQRRLTGA